MQITTHFEDEMEQTKLRSAQLLVVDVTIYRFCLKMETEISVATMLKLNLQGNNIQQDYRRCLSFQSRLDRRQSAATPRLYCSQCLPAQEEKSCLSQLPFAEMASTASSHDAQRP